MFLYFTKNSSKKQWFKQLQTPLKHPNPNTNTILNNNK